jgi:hypothetical protein
MHCTAAVYGPCFTAANKHCTAATDDYFLSLLLLYNYTNKQTGQGNGGLGGSMGGMPGMGGMGGGDSPAGIVK